METNDASATAVITSMILSSAIAETAIRLAQQAGEAVTRPLSEAQLRRAFDVHSAENALVLRMLLAHLDSVPERDLRDD